VARRGTSEGEARLVNAVLRRLVREGGVKVDAEAAHPGWLVGRWRAQFGEAATAELLKWNQQAAQAYLHAPGVGVDAARAAGLEPSEWRGFWRVGARARAAALQMVAAGEAYFQDPFTRHPVDLLNPVSGERILDACAAPGGKSWQIARRMTGGGLLVAVDRSGARLDMLRANLARVRGPEIAVYGHDLTATGAAPWEADHPGGFDGVLIDVPCSNTGVIGRRPDVKLRLTEVAIAEQAARQFELLCAVARQVRGGGRMVYSTCSLESEENDGVVERFLAAHPRFRLNERRLSLPWRDHHDGGAAYLLRTDD